MNLPVETLIAGVLTYFSGIVNASEGEDINASTVGSTPSSTLTYSRFNVTS